MVIHWPGNRRAQRMDYLDTVADMDLISEEVVESFDLETERYLARAIKLARPITPMLPSPKGRSHLTGMLLNS